MMPKHLRSHKKNLHHADYTHKKTSLVTRKFTKPLQSGKKSTPPWRAQITSSRNDKDNTFFRIEIEGHYVISFWWFGLIGFDGLKRSLRMREDTTNLILCMGSLVSTAASFSKSWAATSPTSEGGWSVDTSGFGAVTPGSSGYRPAEIQLNLEHWTSRSPLGKKIGLGRAKNSGCMPTPGGGASLHCLNVEQMMGCQLPGKKWVTEKNKDQFIIFWPSKSKGAPSGGGGREKRIGTDGQTDDEIGIDRNGCCIDLIEEAKKREKIKQYVSWLSLFEVQVT